MSDLGASSAAGPSSLSAQGGEHPRTPAQRVHSSPMTGGPALVLNASMEPLAVISARRAVVLVLSSRAEVIHEDGAWFRSERLMLRAPTVVRLTRYVRVPRRTHSGLSRRAVFLRDGGRCQYCGAPAEDVDHVLPRSRGGPHHWENVVAACRRCNAAKQDRTPLEAGLTLRATPKMPPPAFWLVVRAGKAGEHWWPYLLPYLGQRWGEMLTTGERA